MEVALCVVGVCLTQLALIPRSPLPCLCSSNAQGPSQEIRVEAGSRLLDSFCTCCVTLTLDLQLLS